MIIMSRYNIFVVEKIISMRWKVLNLFLKFGIPFILNKLFLTADFVLDETLKINQVTFPIE